MTKETEMTDEGGYCAVADQPLPEPPCGLERPCPTHDVEEPTRFAFFRDGLLVAGTLADWAKMWEGDYYAGDVDLATKMWTWDDGEKSDPVERKVKVEQGIPTENDYIPYVITVPGLHDKVTVSIDGRN